MVMKLNYSSDDPCFSKLDRKTNLSKLSEVNYIDNESREDLYFQIFIDTISHQVEIHIVELVIIDNDTQFYSLIHMSPVQATLMVNNMAAYHLREMTDQSINAPEKIFYISMDRHQIKMERISEGFSFRLKGQELLRFTNAESLQSFMVQLIDQVKKSTDYEAQINAPRTDFDDMYTNHASDSGSIPIRKRKPKKNLKDLYNEIANEDSSDCPEV